MESSESRGHPHEYRTAVRVTCAWCGATVAAPYALLLTWSGWSVRHPKDVIAVERRKIPRYCPRCAKGLPPNRFR